MRHLNKDIMTYLEQLEEVEHYSEAGSFRRYKEVSKDLDYIIEYDTLFMYNNTF